MFQKTGAGGGVQAVEAGRALLALRVRREVGRARGSGREVGVAVQEGQERVGRAGRAAPPRRRHGALRRRPRGPPGRRFPGLAPRGPAGSRTPCRSGPGTPRASSGAGAAASGGGAAGVRRVVPGRVRACRSPVGPGMLPAGWVPGAGGAASAAMEASFSSSFMFFLKDLMPLARSPIRPLILDPPPKSSRITSSTTSQCQMLKVPMWSPDDPVHGGRHRRAACPRSPCQFGTVGRRPGGANAKSARRGPGAKAAPYHLAALLFHRSGRSRPFGQMGVGRLSAVATAAPPFRRGERFRAWRAAQGPLALRLDAEPGDQAAPAVGFDGDEAAEPRRGCSRRPRTPRVPGRPAFCGSPRPRLASSARRATCAAGMLAGATRPIQA